LCQYAIYLYIYEIDENKTLTLVENRMEEECAKLKTRTQRRYGCLDSPSV